jgi:hypothetical protein
MSEAAVCNHIIERLSKKQEDADIYGCNFGKLLAKSGEETIRRVGELEKDRSKMFDKLDKLYIVVIALSFFSGGNFALGLAEFFIKKMSGQ